MNNLLIAVDYDGTYSADPKTFDLVISEFQQNGHKCIVVTARDESEPVNVNPNLGLDVYYTSGQLKDPFMRENHDIDADIWIEDRPQSVGKEDNWLFDEKLKHWYQNCHACGGVGEHDHVGMTGLEHIIPEYYKGPCSDCGGTGRWMPEPRSIKDALAEA